MPNELNDVPAGWTLNGGRLKQSFRFGGFAQALAFMVEVGLFCEKADRHPDWTNSYNRVDVVLTTHDAGRVTDKDLALARHMNAVFERFRAGQAASSA